MLAPAAYDLASLLQDARIDVPEQLEIALLTHYIKARRASDDSFDPADFAELYAIMSAQRNTKLLGIFARLNRRDGKPQYLRHLPRIWSYLNRSLAHPTLSRFPGMVCRQRPSASCRDLPLVSHPSPLICRRPCRLERGVGCLRAEQHHGRQNGARASVLHSNAASRAHMMGIDGTWRRDCMMEDVSETGAKLTVEGSVEGLHLKEFFLLLSSTGLAYRRCELSWVNGDQIGVNFLKQGDKKKKRRGAAPGRRSLNPRHPGRTTVMSGGYGDEPSMRAESRDMICRIFRFSRILIAIRCVRDDARPSGTMVREISECPSSPPKPWSSPPVSACACAP